MAASSGAGSTGGGSFASQTQVILDLPFRIVSGTIGQGTFAFIRKAVPERQSYPVVAIKFINKAGALKHRMRPKQLKMEILLHQQLGKHQNIIYFINHGEDRDWLWIAMELAEGGDLFDKIEADEGIAVDVAHLYFCQMISAVSYMHDKGIAHRDIKPENVLLSGEGDLKLADFGLATLFAHKGQRKLCTTVCGSPPYVAPEILQIRELKRGGDLANYGYDPVKSDIWSCGIVLFLLLVGNTPWDEACEQTSPEFAEYLQTVGRPDDELWAKLSPDILSLLRGMLKVSSQERFSLEEVRRHPWFTRTNPHLAPSGKAANPLGLATQMLESLRIDFEVDPASQSQQERRRRIQTQNRHHNYMKYPSHPQHQYQHQHLPLHNHPAGISTGRNNQANDCQNPTCNPDEDLMDLDHISTEPLFAASQPIASVAAACAPHEWLDRTSRLLASGGFTASQPSPAGAEIGSGPGAGASSSYTGMRPPRHGQVAGSVPAASLIDHLSSTDPSLSQFAPTPSVPLSLTQQARQFRDIVPAFSLARFLSPLSVGLLVPRLCEALERLGVPPLVAGRATDRGRVGVAIGSAGGEGLDASKSEHGPRPGGGSGEFYHKSCSSSNVSSSSSHRLNSSMLEEEPQSAHLTVRVTDGRRQALTGTILIDPYADGILQVRFVKSKGDPVEWRRFFKRVAVLCKDAILLPSGGGRLSYF